MKLLKHLMLALSLTTLALNALADTATSKSNNAQFKLPPLMYVSSVKDDIFSLLAKKEIFSQLDKELYGSALRLVVTHTFAPTAGGTAAGLTSAMLAGGTLGLLPIVTNNDLVITYTIYAHGNKVASFSYSKNFTQAINIYTDQGGATFDKPIMEWVTTTIDSFVVDAGKDQALRDLTEEYNFYFEAKKT